MPMLACAQFSGSLHSHAIKRESKDHYRFFAEVKAHVKGVSYCEGLIDKSTLDECIRMGTSLTATLKCYGVLFPIRWVDLF